ncbi:hypothetical protein [Demequina sp.]|uniref:hypothetical protein n=1 Tax=Demequina sp. TaxID=2050685 RepID=UPI0025B8FF7A|nr:hypothetical protein [Demequina sp.]
MLDGAPSEVLAGSCGYTSRIASWRGGELLASSVPLIGGRPVWRADDAVPDQLRFTVARVVDGFDWLPGEGDVTHPLAPLGQELDVTVIVTSDVTSIAYETRRGRFQIQETTEDSPGVLSVVAAGVFQVIADDRLPAPLAPREDGTLFSEFRRQVPAGVPVAIDAALADRACPQSLQWSEDRLDNLYTIADAIPAVLRPGPSGQAVLAPQVADDAEPVLTLSEGERRPGNDYPVVVGKARRRTRDGVFNAVVARGAVTDDPSTPPVWAEAIQMTGPFAATSTGFRVKRKFFASPLLTTEAQCLAAANTMLASALRPAKVIPIELPPDPRIELGDVLRVRADEAADGSWGVDIVGVVVGLDLPLTYDDGAMRLDVAVIS